MTFDLEKARKIVDAMSPTPWIVLEDRYGQIDVIRNPNHPMHKEGVIELWGMTSETATPDAIGISYMRSEFPNALDKIERLQGEMENYGDDYVCQMKSKDARIQELEAQLALTTSALENATRKPDVIDATGTGNLDFSDTNVVDDLIKNGNSLRARAHKAEARIKELEDAHKRSGEKYAKIINELRSSVYANTPGLKKQWDEILNAPANGKIRPDTEPANIQALQRVMRKQHDHTAEMTELNADHPYPPEAPRSWQITDERKAAIRDAEIALRDAVLDSNDPHCWDAETAVLRAMLTEADHDKP